MNQIGTIQLFSDQFPAEAIPVRVIEQHGQLLVLEAIGDSMRLQSLVSNRSVVAIMSEDGDAVSYTATFKRMSGGLATIKYDKSNLLTRRHFERLDTKAELRFASIPTNQINQSRLSRLRWMKTETRDISAGGVLFTSETELTAGNTLLLSLSIADVSFPSLLAGEVKHCRADEDEFLVGMRFMTNEEYTQRRSLALLGQSVDILKKFNTQKQASINTDIVAKKYDKHRNGELV